MGQLVGCLLCKMLGMEKVWLPNDMLEAHNIVNALLSTNSMRAADVLVDPYLKHARGKWQKKVGEEHEPTMSEVSFPIQHSSIAREDAILRVLRGVFTLVFENKKKPYMSRIQSLTELPPNAIHQICKGHRSLTMVWDPHWSCKSGYWASPFPQSKQAMSIIERYIGAVKPHGPRSRLSIELSNIPELRTISPEIMELILWISTQHNVIVEEELKRGDRRILLYQGSKAQEKEIAAANNTAYEGEMWEKRHIATYEEVATKLRDLLSDSVGKTMELANVKRQFRASNLLLSESLFGYRKLTNVLNALFTEVCWVKGTTVQLSEQYDMQELDKLPEFDEMLVASIQKNWHSL